MHISNNTSKTAVLFQRIEYFFSVIKKQNSHRECYRQLQEQDSSCAVLSGTFVFVIYTISSTLSLFKQQLCKMLLDFVRSNLQKGCFVHSGLMKRAVQSFIKNILPFFEEISVRKGFPKLNIKIIELDQFYQHHQRIMQESFQKKLSNPMKRN